jgi:uncharacterized membrane protein
LGRLEDAKILGGIGSILQIIPGISIAGYILVLIAIKKISDEVKDGTIFTKMLYAVITGIIGVALVVYVIFFGAILSVFTFGFGAFLGVIAAFAIGWIALIVSSIFVRDAFDMIATRLNVGTFRTAGTLYFVGALLTIIFIGFLILFVAYIVQVIAFFSIHEAQPMAPPPITPSPMTSAPAATAAPAPQSSSKYCANCGTQMASFAMYCPKCGARQP